MSARCHAASSAKEGPKDIVFCVFDNQVWMQVGKTLLGHRMLLVGAHWRSRKYWKQKGLLLLINVMWQVHPWTKWSKCMEGQMHGVMLLLENYPHYNLTSVFRACSFWGITCVPSVSYSLPHGIFSVLSLHMGRRSKKKNKTKVNKQTNIRPSEACVCPGIIGRIWSKSLTVRAVI